MNIELEKNVINAMYQKRHTTKKQYFFFNEISKMSNVKKSSLQRVLARLVKRDWIRKTHVRILRDKIKISNFKEKKDRRKICYTLIGYPYIGGLGGLIKSQDYNDVLNWSIPSGTKRFWKKAAKEILEFRKIHKNKEERPDRFANMRIQLAVMNEIQERNSNFQR